MDITWEEPPVERVRSLSKYDLIGLELRKAPGKWARVGDYRSHAPSTHIKRRLGPEFEVHTQTVSLPTGERRVRIWARLRDSESAA